MTEPADPPFPVLLFDGDCGFCARSVQFVLDHNGANDVHFAPLQSELAATLCEPHGIDPGDLDSLVLVTSTGAFTRSDGAIQIARYLDRPWRFAAALRFVPRPLRDAGYRLIARNRHRLGRQSDTCRIPTESERRRFLA